MIVDGHFKILRWNYSTKYSFSIVFTFHSFICMFILIDLFGFLIHFSVFSLESFHLSAGSVARPASFMPRGNSPHSIFVVSVCFMIALFRIFII